MNRSNVSPASLLPRFLMMLIAFNILMIAISWALAYFTSISMPSGVAAVIPVVTAAQDAGQTYYRRAGELPSNSFSWSVAALFTAVNTGFNAILVALFVGLMVKLTGESLALPALPRGQDSLALAIIGGVLLFLLLVQLLAVRFSFGSGAKQQAKLQAAKTA